MEKKKKIITFQADLIFLIHCLIVFVIVFGWAFAKLNFIYPLVLVATLVLETIFGYCILTEFEFRLRKKIEPSLEYDHSFVTYYMHKIYDFKIPRRFLDIVYKSFLIVSLMIYFVKTFIIT